MSCVDWENTLIVFVDGAYCKGAALQNRSGVISVQVHQWPIHPRTHMATQSTFNTPVLLAPTHTASSDMTRGYPTEQCRPLPTMASEPQQLLKLEVLGLFRKQDSGLCRAQAAGWPHVFPLKERLHSHTHGRYQKTLRRDDLWSTRLIFLLKAANTARIQRVEEEGTCLTHGASWLA